MRGRRGAGLVAAVLVVGLVAACGDGADRSVGVGRRAAEAPTAAPSEVTVGTVPATVSTTVVPVAPPSTTVPAPAPTTTPVPTSTRPPASVPTPSPVGAPTVEVERCATAVTFGSVQVRALGGCLTRTGLVWATSGPVNVAGLWGEPSGSARLVVDPLNARIAGSGYSWSLRGQDGADPWSLPLGSWTFDWSFQFDPAVTAYGSLAVGDGAVGARTAAQARLPGLGSVRALPEIHRGIRDFAALDDAAVGEYVAAHPEVASATPVFSFGALGLRSFAPLEWKIPSLVTEQLFGLPVDPTLTLAPQNRGGTYGMAIGLALRLPTVLRGADGAVAVFVGSDGSLAVDQARIFAPSLSVGVVTFRPVDLRYDASLAAWTGRVGTFLGVTRNAPGLVAELAVREGALQRIGLTLAGLPVPLGATGFSLTAAGGTLQLEPFGVAGRLAVAFGPPAGGFSVDGTGAVDEERTSVTGDLLVAGLKVGDVELGYRYGDRASVAGSFGLYLDDKEQLGLSGRIDGFVAADAVQLGGKVRLALYGVGEIVGDAMVSDVGVAACGTLGSKWFAEWRMGFGYRWGGSPELLGATCNTATYLLKVRTQPTATTVRPAVARADAEPGAVAAVLVASRADAADATRGPAAIVVPEGQQVLQVLLEAPGGVGSVRVVGPDGTVVDPAAVGRYTPGDRVAVVRGEDDTQVVVLVGEPAPGRWTVEPAGGSAVAVTAEVTAQGFRPLAPTVPVPLSEVETTGDGRVVPPALPEVPGETPARAGTAPGPTDRAEPSAGRDRALPSSGDADGTAPWVWVLLGAAVVVVLAGVTVGVVVRRRRA